MCLERTHHSWGPLSHSTLLWLQYEPVRMWAPGAGVEVVYHQHLKQCLAHKGDWFIHDQDYPSLFLPFLTQSSLVLTLHGDFQLGSRKGSQMGIFKKIDLRKREVVPPIYAFIGWFLHLLYQRLHLQPCWYMGWRSNQLGYPPGPSQMWILVLVAPGTDASVSLNLSPHKRIRNNTSPISLLGCED